jgi:hypothetical protein
MAIKNITENIIEIDGERYVKEDSKGWLDIPELGISIEIEVHDKNKSWDKLGLKDREDELLTTEQCIWLANSKYAKTLKMDGGSYSDDFFIKQPFKLNKKQGYVAQFYTVSGSVVLGTDFGSDYSDSYLGVRFAKNLVKNNLNGQKKA